MNICARACVQSVQRPPPACTIAHVISDGRIMLWSIAALMVSWSKSKTSVFAGRWLHKPLFHTCIAV